MISKLRLLLLFVFSASPLAITTLSASDYTADAKIEAVKPDPTISQVEKWRLMTGKWFGSQPTKNGKTLRWIVDRAEDGTYQVRFREYKSDGTFRESIEVGEWGISGPIYFSIFKGRIHDGRLRRVNPTDPYNRDAYKIITLNDNIFVYESLEVPNRYTVKRVSPLFDFDSQ